MVLMAEEAEKERRELTLLVEAVLCALRPKPGEAGAGGTKLAPFLSMAIRQSERT
jgi:hypothetical protein